MKDQIFIHADLLKALSECAKITGSFARGDEKESSDIDFYIPENKWKEFKEKVGHLKCDSTAIGQICFVGFDLIEISWRFKRIPKTKRLPARILNGITFKTY